MNILFQNNEFLEQLNKSLLFREDLYIHCMEQNKDGKDDLWAHTCVSHYSVPLH